MFVINPTKKKIITSLVKRGKNCLVTGPTGCGKTSLCFEIAKELDLNPVVVNMGSTQDARATLIGYHSLKDGETKFHKSEFLQSVSTPNTLIILDELSRSSDDGFNILFPILDFRKDIHVEEINETVKVDSSVRFIATANIGFDYTSARKLDRALRDRFVPFNLSYISGDKFCELVRKMGLDVNDEFSSVKMLAKIYDFSHSQYNEGKLSSMISTRMLLDSIPLLEEFTVCEVFENVLLSMFEEDSSNIVNDASILREFADSVGVFG